MKVYDAKGRVLEVGSPVENVGLHGSVLGFSTDDIGLYVDVDWGACPNCEDGAVVEPACCGNTTSSGECRGDCAVPSEQPCPTCGGAAEITEPFTAHRTVAGHFRCPDLLLITDEEKGDGDATR